LVNFPEWNIHEILLSGISLNMPQSGTFPARIRAVAESDVELKLCNLPPIPDAATKLLRITVDESVELRTIQKVLASDPSLGAEVLRLANSPLFAFHTVIHSLEHSITLMGLNRVRSLALAIAMRSCWNIRHPAHHKCWAHGVATAVIAEALAAFSEVRKEDAFTAGLLHDIGRMGLLKSYPAEYGPLIAAEYKDCDAALTAERWLMKMDHCVAGAHLGKAWDFPTPLQKVVREHHSEIDTAEDSLLTVTQVACLLAGSFGYPEISFPNPPGEKEIVAYLHPAAQRLIHMHRAEIGKRIQDRLSYLTT
jgi:putative nucleotidyltransferase with HDIG domain